MMHRRSGHSNAGTVRFLDAIRETGLTTRFYQASTSESYGKAREVPQTETTPFYPRSLDGVARLYGYSIIIETTVKRTGSLHATASCLIMNRQDAERVFVTRKITLAAAADGVRIAEGSAARESELSA